MKKNYYPKHPKGYLPPYSEVKEEMDEPKRLKPKHKTERKRKIRAPYCPMCGTVRVLNVDGFKFCLECAKPYRVERVP